MINLNLPALVLIVAQTALAAIITSAHAQTSPAAGAQNYPNKPVRVLVGFTAGASVDIIARLVAQQLAEEMGGSTIVENRPGAGGNIAAEAVAKSPADGYTLLFGNNSLATSVSLYSKLPYNAARDFAPVSQVSRMAHVLVVNPSIPAKSVQDLIALAKRKPGELNLAASGIGAPDHMAGELFKFMAGVDIVHIAYKGGPPALADLIGGQAAMSFPAWPLASSHVTSGRIRALGVTTSKRLSVLPDVPTISEAGLNGYESVNWTALFVPANTPRDVVARLSSEVAKILKKRDVQTRFEALGVEPVSSTPDELAAFFQSEAAKWGKLIKAAGTKLD